MKMYDKSELTYMDGYIVNGDNEIVTIDPCVVKQINQIETAIQKRNWYNHQPKFCAGPDYNQFERTSEHKTVIEFNIDTPNLDAQVEKSIALMKEIDAVDTTTMMNEFVQNVNTAVQFCANDKVIDYEGSTLIRFDLPMIGDPLKLDADTLAQWIRWIYTDQDDEE